MDSSTLDSLRTDAQNTGNDANKIAQDVPGMLSSLKTNLNSVFTKDNPMFASRENALQTFLNAPSQTRSDLLPSNQPIIGGSALNFNPTQQDAIVTARRNAALVPLAGLNQSIVGQYGNVNDMLGNAANIFSTQAQAAKDKATNALNLYQSAISEYNALHSNANAGGFGGDLSAILTAILSSQHDQPAPAATPDNGWEIVDPNAPKNIDIPNQGTIQSYNPVPLSQPAPQGPTFNATPNYLNSSGTGLNLLGGLSGDGNHLGLTF